MQAEYITKALNGKWYGRYGIAFCPVHDNRCTPSLSVSEGDNGKLLVYCHAGCNSVDILKTLSQKGFLENFQQSKSYHNHARKQTSSHYDTSQFIAKILQESCPIDGTLAERYLKETRGIKCPLNPTLKYHSNLYHSPTKQLFPAICRIFYFYTIIKIL